MRVEDRGAGGPVLLGAERGLQFRLFGPPLRRLLGRRERLRESAPARVSDEELALLRAGGTILVGERAQDPDRFQVGAEFPFGTAFAEPIRFGQPVVVPVEPSGSSSVAGVSGGSRRYLSRRISQA